MLQVAPKAAEPSPVIEEAPKQDPPKVEPVRHESDGSNALFGILSNFDQTRECFEDQKEPKWVRNALYSPFQLPQRLANEENPFFRTTKQQTSLKMLDFRNVWSEVWISIK